MIRMPSWLNWSVCHLIATGFYPDITILEQSFQTVLAALIEIFSSQKYWKRFFLVSWLDATVCFYFITLYIPRKISQYLVNIDITIPRQYLAISWLWSSSTVWLLLHNRDRHSVQYKLLECILSIHFFLQFRPSTVHISAADKRKLWEICSWKKFKKGGQKPPQNSALRRLFSDPCSAHA
jgi:hypothetical protein